MKIVADWKTIPKHISFICMGIYASAIAVFNMLPIQMQQSFNQQELRWASFILISIGMVGKYVDQSKRYIDENDRTISHD